MNLWTFTSSTLLIYIYLELDKSLRHFDPIESITMISQNPFVALILITSLLCVTAQSNESASRPMAATSKKSISKLGQVALDAINISIAEISHAKHFIDSIPKLKSLGDVPGGEVLECVGALTGGINDVLSELRKLELDSWYGGTWGLEKKVNSVVSFNDLCDFALADVDEIFKLMVHRKLEDIVLLTSDVIFRVSKL